MCAAAVHVDTAYKLTSKLLQRFNEIHKHLDKEMYNPMNLYYKYTSRPIPKSSFYKINLYTYTDHQY